MCLLVQLYMLWHAIHLIQTVHMLVDIKPQASVLTLHNSAGIHTHTLTTQGAYEHTLIMMSSVWFCWGGVRGLGDSVCKWSGLNQHRGNCSLEASQCLLHSIEQITSGPLHWPGTGLTCQIRKPNHHKPPNRLVSDHCLRVTSLLTPLLAHRSQSSPL